MVENVIQSPGGATILTVKSQSEENGKTEEDVRQGLPESVKIEQASEPMRLRLPDPKAKGPWIQYDGVGTVRIMTVKDWEAAGVDSNRYCEWNYLNKKRLPRSIFTDEELQYLLRVDGRFSLVGDVVVQDN